MAFDSFLWFQSRTPTYLPKGESQDPQFGIAPYNAFEIKSFNFSVQNNVTIGSQSQGAGAGKCVLEKFKFQKTIDTGSASLFAACAAGKHVDAAVLVLRKAGGVGDTSAAYQPCYLVFKFLFCYIDTISWSGSSGDDVPAEDVSFAYGAMEITYNMQDSTGALMTPAYKGQWSQVNNQSVFMVSSVASGILGSAIVVPSGVASS